ncbi:MAG: UDP-N-acetylmuramoyl-L-alanine--D-glutamate ligase [Fluviibacter sp.]
MTTTLISSQTTPADLNGRRVLVVGLGESGLAMARWLHAQQAQIAVVDTRALPPGMDVLAVTVPDAEWRSRGAALEGALIDACLAAIDLLVLSPGVAFDSALVCAARSRDIPVWSEVDCFNVARRAACPVSRVLAITGANGKTTTTALTAHLLNAAGIDAVACGNISPSMLDAFMARQASGLWPAVWVLELSSFQLEATQCMQSDAAIILNLSEDHLDRHVTMAGYAAAKGRIYEACAQPLWNRADHWADAYGLDLATAASIGDDVPTNARDFGLVDGWIVRGADRIVAMADLPLLGRHNALNVQAALALAAPALLANQTLRDLIPGIRSFRSLPHRVTLIATRDEVRYVDDSKATNVGATLAAIDGLFDPAQPQKKLALLLGGEGKGQDFAPLSQALERAGRAVALIGKDAGAIAAILPASLPVQRFADLSTATRWLADQAQPGDTVLLSPACASLDMFRNYAERAQVFIDAVQTLNSCAPMKNGAAA